MMAVMATAVVGCNDRANECRQGICSLPLCSHPCSLPQSHVILEKGPPTCETWGGCARLGSCHCPGSLGTWALQDTHYPHSAAFCNPTVSPKTCCWPLFPQPRASAERAGLCPTSSPSLAGLGAGQQHVQSPAWWSHSGDLRYLQLPLHI